MEVFAAQGFREASIKDIAMAAGVNSPGLIYHYFANKEELLKAALAHFAPPLRLAGHMEQLAELPVRDGMLAIANAYLAILTEPAVINSMRVMIGEALRSEEFAQVLAEAGPLKVWNLITHYLRHLKQAGTLQIENPETAARCFMAPLFAHVFLCAMLRIPDPLNISPTLYAEQCVDLFLKGAAPQGDPING